MLTTVAENWLPKQPQNYLVETLLPRNWKKNPNLVIPYKNEEEGKKIDSLFLFKATSEAFQNIFLHNYKRFFFLKESQRKKEKGVFAVFYVSRNYNLQENITYDGDDAQKILCQKQKINQFSNLCVSSGPNTHL